MRSGLAGLLALAALFAAGCGDVSQGRAPTQVVVEMLEVASGAEPTEFGGTLDSDVQTVVTTPAPCSTSSPCPTIFNDVAEVTMSLVARDPGVPGIAASPSPLNSVTINRYRVEYLRSDGLNAPGVDVPWPFDSALTFTIPFDGSATAGFTIVRHSAKQEAPLAALAVNGNLISTIARVTFYGVDVAGNAVTASANVGVNFGNFADPD